MHRLITLFLILAFAGVAGAETVVDYGWEDDGDVLAIYPDEDSIIPSNVAEWEPGEQVYDGNFALKLVDNAESGTPQAYLVYLWFLQDGDEITVSFYRYDDSPEAAPSVRIWGHWNHELPGNPEGYSGSAGGNGDYGPGEGWDQTEYTWTAVDGHSGLVIEARTYSLAGDTVWLDNLHIEAPDHVWIQIPGCSSVGPGDATWSDVKSLFR
jgi:hypothetical protein